LWTKFVQTCQHPAHFPEEFCRRAADFAWRETALVAIQMAKAESRFVRSNHFFRTISFVRLALPRSSISLTMFESFSGMLVRIIASQFDFETTHVSPPTPHKVALICAIIGDYIQL